LSPPNPVDNIVYMDKRGRRVATPMEFRVAVAQRIKTAREVVGLTHKGIAQRLTAAIGRDISADTYRKWETVDSAMPLDAVLAFCDVARIHPYELLAKASPATELPIPKKIARKYAA
jgi:hypothetical protein